MNYNEQTDAFDFELDNLIKRFRDEFDVNTYTIAGVLEAKKMDILLEIGVDFTGDTDILDDDILDPDILDGDDGGD